MRSCADRFLHAEKQSSEAEKEMINLLTVADLTKEDLPMLWGLLGSEEEGRLQNDQESDGYVPRYVLILTFAS